MGTSAGFVGCLRDFKLGRRPVALHSDHDPTVMVSARAPPGFFGTHPFALYRILPWQPGMSSYSSACDQVVSEFH